ncbi:hypothetical protein NX059_012218 [Plenodomus lindquistii]|nr:hypothetical protein NX059_012218 [Plenodomus lindquistii]
MRRLNRTVAMASWRLHLPLLASEEDLSKVQKEPAAEVATAPAQQVPEEIEQTKVKEVPDVITEDASNKDAEAPADRQNSYVLH